MSPRRRQKPGRKANAPQKARPARGDDAGEQPKAPAPEPVDVVNGIPDRDAAVAPWKYIALAAGVSAWIAFLAAVAVTGA